MVTPKIHDQDPNIVSPEEKLDLSKIVSREQFDKAFTDTYNRDLFPYDNNNFLIKRLNEDNRALRRTPALKEEIDVALIADDDEALLEAAEDISKDGLQSKKPIGAFLSYLTLVQGINDRKVTVANRETPADRANALMILVARNLANSISDDQVTDAHYSARYLQARMDALYAKTHDEHYPFYREKLRHLILELHKRDMANQYIDALPGNDEGTVSEETLKRDSERVKQLFAEVQSTQRYGVKMGYTPDKRGGSLIFSPPYDGRDYLDAPNLNAHHLTLDTPALAEIIHSRAKHPKRLKLESANNTYKNAHGQEELTISLSAEALDPLTNIVLGPDGELYVDRQCTVSYAEIARSKGKYQAYRDLQATILANYFDLTHTAIAPAALEKETNNLTIPSASEESSLKSIERLVIPRLRALSAKAEQQAIDTEEEKGRSVRWHGVVWHIRTLPSGWFASPAAQERAEKLGVTLAPGETIVKAHNRGSKALGEVVGHQLVTLPQDS